MDLMAEGSSTICCLVVSVESDEHYLHYFDPLLVKYCGFRTYTVIACKGYAKAKELLQPIDNRPNFVLLKVNAPSTETFDFIKQVSVSLPIAVVSQDVTRKSVLAAIDSGCCDYYSPPALFDAGATTWQHVARHRDWRHTPPHHTGPTESDGEVDENHLSTTRPKKRRVVWTDELNDEFDRALKRLEPSDHVPKKILAIMKMKHPDLNRENVASHLQKYKEMSIKQVPTRTMVSFHLPSKFR